MLRGKEERRRLLSRGETSTERVAAQLEANRQMVMRGAREGSERRNEC